MFAEMSHNFTCTTECTERRNHHRQIDLEQEVTLSRVKGNGELGHPK